MDRAGKDTRKLLPHVLKYLRTHAGPFYSRFSEGSTSTELQVEGTFISVGRPALLDGLLDTLEVSCVLLFPHFSQRGPNGMLELRRGATHPLTLRTLALSAYVLRTEDGVLYRECYSTRLGCECELIQLFSTIEQTRESAAEEEELDGTKLTPTRIDGTALLEALSWADAIDVHRKDGGIQSLCLTHMGLVVLSEHDESVQIATPDQVLNALADAT
jgi:hypothetical protein